MDVSRQAIELGDRNGASQRPRFCQRRSQLRPTVQGVKPIVAYIRVSTNQQGRPGLGIEAQRAALVRFAKEGDMKFHSEKSLFRLVRRPKQIRFLSDRGACNVRVTRVFATTCAVLEIDEPPSGREENQGRQAGAKIPRRGLAGVQQRTPSNELGADASRPGPHDLRFGGVGVRHLQLCSIDCGRSFGDESLGRADRRGRRRGCAGDDRDERRSRCGRAGPGGMPVREFFRKAHDRSWRGPPHTAVTMAETGYHVALLQVRDKLVEGATFTCSLRFRNAGSMDVEVRVSRSEPDS
jgi:hypothetical protein